MPKQLDVESYLATLKHARIAEIRTLRKAILNIDKGVTEHIKWNAPSFCWKGDDRATMRLHPGGRLELVLHQGVKQVRNVAFSIADPKGLVEWVAKNRGIIRIADSAELKRMLPDIVSLVGLWMRARPSADSGDPSAR